MTNECLRAVAQDAPFGVLAGSHSCASRTNRDGDDLAVKSALNESRQQMAQEREPPGDVQWQRENAEAWTMEWAAAVKSILMNTWVFAPLNLSPTSLGRIRRSNR